jgi:ABC-type transport system involved in multi-copper enzyme maturation permease subunit
MKVRTMTKTFRSEWIKMRRRSVLVGGALMSVFALVFVPLGIANAGGTRTGAGGPQALTVAALDSAKGLTTLLSRGGTLTAVVALAIVAAAMAAEYSHGTLRSLLVRQPRRMHLLTGTFLALLSYVLVAATVAFLVGIAAALVVAPGHGIDTSRWLSSSGLSNLAAMYGDLAITVTAYALLGFASAVVFRSAAAAVAVPLCYIIVIENLIGGVWSGAPDWLFGKAMAAVLNGESVLSAGTTLASYGRGLLVGLLYMTAFAALSLALFRYRDVTT